MDQSLLMDTIPFRCPKCGDSKTFTTLTELRMHLSSDHSFSSSQPQRTGTKVFNYDRSRERSPLLQAFLEDGKRLEEEVRKAKEQEKRNKLLQDDQTLRDRVYMGPISPLAREDSHLRSALSSLSNEVTASRQQQYRTADKLYATQDILNTVEQAAEDQRHRQQLLMSRLAGQVQPSTSTPQGFFHPVPPPNGFVTTAEVHRPPPNVGFSRIPAFVPPVPGFGDQPLGDSPGNVYAKASQLEQAQAEIQRLREDQRKLLDSIEQLRHRADADNQALIQGLRSREHQLQQINQRLAGSISPRPQSVSPTVPHLRQTLAADESASRQFRGQMPPSSPQRKTKDLEADEIPVRDSSPDQDDYHARPSKVRTLLPKVQNKDKEDKYKSEKNSSKRKVDFEEDEQRFKDEVRHRDNSRQRDEHVVALQQRSERLEEDRQLLLQEMENLLSRAASANEKLRSELHSKETQLQQLNKEMQQAKLSQSELLGETIELYSQADSNIAKLKELLLGKEEQLSTANGRLGQMREALNKAISERELEAQEVQGQCRHLQSSLEATQKRLATTEADLQHLSVERERGLQEAARLRSQVESQQSANTRLQQELALQEKKNKELQASIEGKEKQLIDTKKELDSVTSFIKTTAAKELEARKKLEKFITDLINRADNAEQQLKAMRKEVEGPSSAVSGEGRQGSTRSQPTSRPAQDAQPSGTMPLSSSEASDTASLSQLRKLPTSDIKTRAQHALQKNLKPWQPEFAIPPSTQQPGIFHTDPAGVQTRAADTSMLNPQYRPSLESADVGPPGNGGRASYSRHFADQGSSVGAAGHGPGVPLHSQNHHRDMYNSAPSDLDDRVPTRDLLQERHSPYLQNDFDYEGHYAEVDFGPRSSSHPGVSSGRGDRSHSSSAHYSSEAELVEPMYATIAKGGVRSPRHSTPLPPPPPGLAPALPTRERIVRENAGGLQQSPVYPPPPQFSPSLPQTSSRPQSQSYWHGDRGREDVWNEQHMPAPASSLGMRHDQSLGRDYRDGDPRTYVRQYSPSEASYQNGRPPSHVPPSNSTYAGLHGGHRQRGDLYATRSSPGERIPPSAEWLQGRNKAQPLLEESGYGSHYRSMPGQGDLQASSSALGFQPLSRSHADQNYFEPPLVAYRGGDPLERRGQMYQNSSLMDSDDYRERKPQQRRHAPTLRDRQMYGSKRTTDTSRPPAIQPTASFESDSGWDGRELSVDENGIMWEGAPDATWTKDWEDQDSCRFSPSGSETAGDVDSSLLYSGSSSSPHVLSRSSPPKETASNGSLGSSLDEKFAKFLGKDWRKNLGGEKLSPVKEEIIGQENSGGRYARLPSRLAERKDMPKKDSLKSSYRAENGPASPLRDSGARNGKKLDAVQEDVIIPTSRQVSKQSAEKPRLTERSGNSLQNGKADNQSKQRDYRASNVDKSENLKEISKVTAAVSPTSQNNDKSKTDVASKQKAEIEKDTVKRDSAGTEATAEQRDSRKDNNEQLAPEKPPRSLEARRGSLAKQKSLYPEKMLVSEEIIPAESSDFSQGRNRPEGTEEDKDLTKPPANGRKITETGRVVPNKTDTVKNNPVDAGSPGEDSGKKKLVAPMQTQQMAADRPSLDNSVNPPGDQYTLTEEDMIEIANAPRKRAQPLRTRFAEDSSDEDSESAHQPDTGSGSLQQAEESTDFDLESDFEKVSNPSLLASKTVSKKSPARKAIIARRKAKASRRNPAAAFPGLRSVMTDEESSTMSDQDDPKKRRKEEARRRRIALFRVFTYLDTRTLCLVSQVCREWKRVSRHASLWKRVVLKNERISSEFLATISQWCSQLHTLTLEGIRVRAKQDNETVEEYQQNTRASLEPGLEQLLKASQNSLRCLTILDCGNILTDKSLWLASCYSRLLERLTYVSDTDPVGPELFFALGGGCPGITSLVIPPLHPCAKPALFSNKCLLLISKFYRDLLVLGVGGREINKEGLLPLVQSCQRLQSLQLDHTVEVTEDLASKMCKAGLNSLMELQLIGTPVSDKAIKVFHKSCKHLTRIHIVITIMDYFEDVTTKKNKEAYKKAVDNLRKLEKYAGLGNILTLQAAPVE